MASTYGPNFGFRRSDETLSVREGRQRVPTAATTWKQGFLVTPDTAAPGYLKLPDTTALTAGELNSGTYGLIVQEEDHVPDLYDKTRLGWATYDLGGVKPGRLAIMWSGIGVKVWMKNTKVQNRVDGVTVPAVTMFTATGLAVGDWLKFDGTKWLEGTALNGFLQVTLYDASGGAGAEYLEAVVAK